MEEPKTETTSPEQVETGLPEAPESEVTDDPQEQIQTLHAQKEHQRLKREEAEKAQSEAVEDARLAREELAQLKTNQTSAPSDIEISQKYPDWEYKEEDEKSRIRNEESREKRLRQLEEKIAWDNDYNSILKKYPQLAESEEEFKKEAYKHPKSISLDVIAKSYLFDKKVPETTETPARPGLESPTGGPKTPLSTGMTLEDITRLRKEEPQKYSDMVRKGLIKVPKA